MKQEKSSSSFGNSILEASLTNRRMNNAEIILRAMAYHKGEASVGSIVRTLKTNEHQWAEGRYFPIEGRKRFFIGHPYGFDREGFFNFVMIMLAPEFDRENKDKFVEEIPTTPYPQRGDQSQGEWTYKLSEWHMNRVFRLKNPSEFLKYQRKTVKEVMRRTKELKKRSNKKGIHLRLVKANKRVGDSYQIQP